MLRFLAFFAGSVSFPNNFQIFSFFPLNSITFIGLEELPEDFGVDMSIVSTSLYSLIRRLYLLPYFSYFVEYAFAGMWLF